MKDNFYLLWMMILLIPVFNVYSQNNIIKNNYSSIENTEEKTYLGWWVYGEGQHIFKDEQSLGEWDLFFPKENMDELVDLYLSITEMEYFPVESVIQANVFEKESAKIIEIADLEVTYIQGCGD